MSAIQAFAVLAFLLAGAAAEAPLSYSQWLDENPGSSRAERRAALKSWLDFIHSGPAPQKVAPPRQEFVPEAKGEKMKPSDSDSTSYGAWLRQNPGRTPAERRIALKAHLDKVHGTPTPQPKVVDKKPTKQDIAAPASKNATCSKTQPRRKPAVVSYGEWVHHNLGKTTRNQRREALTKYLNKIPLLLDTQPQDDSNGACLEVLEDTDAAKMPLLLDAQPQDDSNGTCLKVLGATDAAKITWL